MNKKCRENVRCLITGKNGTDQEKRICVLFKLREFLKRTKFLFET